MCHDKCFERKAREAIKYGWLFKKSPFFSWNYKRPWLIFREPFLDRKWKVIEKVYKDVITLHLDADRVRNFASIQFIDLVHAVWSSLARYIQKRKSKYCYILFWDNKICKRKKNVRGEFVTSKKYFTFVKKIVNNLLQYNALEISKI